MNHPTISKKHHALLTESLIKMGWEVKNEFDFVRTFVPKSDKKFWNCPQISIYNRQRGRKKHFVLIMKFTGQNDWCGKFENVFRGYIGEIYELKYLLRAVEINKYKKFKW